MSQTERSALRSLIRQRFQLLRQEVDERKAELLMELERALTAKFEAQDQQWADAAFAVAEAARAANRQANDIVRALVGPTWEEREIVTAVRVGRPDGGRTQMRREGLSSIETRVKQAQLKLTQQEVDLLTRLAAGVLVSDEAQTFLSTIPTVSALVPAVRLLELERSLTDPAAE